MSKTTLILSAMSGLMSIQTVWAQQQPNIIVIYTDDMGIGDLSCYNSGWVRTPNIDRLAQQGIKFNHYYTASPVSSPSRTGITTGMFPTEWGINTFLHERKGNANCEQCDYLDSKAPTIAKSLQAAGYATAHIGKWHMGGGRDVDDAPQIPEYGFDEYVTTYEGPDPDKLLTASNWIWSEKDSIQRWDRTAYFVDKTLDFLKRKKGKPCFVNLWPDDMHDPWIPSEGFYPINETWSSRNNFVAVLTQYDKQIGRLLDGIESMGLTEKTLIIFTSDNGALPTFDNARTNGLRGSKNCLYEGGINMPFLVSWPGTIPTGMTDNESLINAVDIYPSLCAIVGAKQIAGFEYSGEDMSASLLGKERVKRSKDMMWDFGRNRFFGKGEKGRNSPHLAIRRDKWKLLVDSNGENIQLFDMSIDPHETNNVAQQHPKLCKELSERVIEWYFTKRKVRGN